MVTVDKVKACLRVSHNKLNNQFESDIAEAKSKMMLAGISSDAVALENDANIDSTIIAYCRMVEAPTQKAREGFQVQYEQWLDELRKSPEYMKNV